MTNDDPYRYFDGASFKEDEVLQLRANIKKIEDIIFATGAPLGSEAYFQIREICRGAEVEPRTGAGSLD